MEHLKSFFSLVAASADAEGKTFFSRLDANIAEPIALNLADFYKDLVNEISTTAAASQKSFDNGVIGAYFATVVFFLLGLLLVVVVIRNIRIPLRELKEVSELVIEGDFSAVRSTRRKDEIGVIMNKFHAVTEVVSSMIGDINKMSEEQVKKGDLDYYLDESKYSGKFKTVVNQINGLSKSVNNDVEILIGAIKKFAQGDFDAKLKRFPGKKALLNEAIDTLEQNLNLELSDIETLIEESINGRLDARADLNKHRGGWKKIMAALNKLIDAIVEPIQEAKEVIGLLREGVLSVKVVGDYKGDFDDFKASINDMIDELKKYIGNINETLGELAQDNYNVEVKINYKGDFGPIKTALNNIIERVNKVMGAINDAAFQVAEGSKQISGTSMELSRGAMSQSAAIQEANALMNSIMEQTSRAFGLSKDANSLTEQISSNAMEGKEKMRSMLSSMEEITKVSNNIASIIKIIEEIAFQTNLLALNAAVEAARAGNHGLGFAVVADEVRNLAIKSHAASRDTSALIENALQRVSDGNDTANDTADALNKIVKGISTISTYVKNIADDSKGQSESITQVNAAMSQISGATQKNAAISEETAASSEVLTRQAELFKNMVSEFKLRR
jgi:methyl-accepting chemotaxis protein